MSDGAPLGEIIYSSVKPMIRLYMILFTGFGLTRMGLFGVQTARACSDLVLMVFMPALVFDKVVSYISISDIETIGVICFSAVVFYALNATITTLIIYLTPVPKDPKSRWVGGAYLAGIMQNVSDLPIAYIQALTLLSTDQQNKGVAYVIIWLAMYVMAQFNFGLFKLVEWDFSYGKKNKHSNEEEGCEQPSLSNTETKEATTTSTCAPSSYSTNSIRSSIDSEEESINSDDHDPESLIAPESTSDKADHQKPKPRRFSNRSLEPVSLNLEKLTTVLSQHSKHIALSRIPSARNNAIPLADNNINFNDELVREYSHKEPYNQNISKNMRIITDDIHGDYPSATSGEDEKNSFIAKYHLGFLVFFLQNFKKPNSISLIVSLTCALVPWLKALFTNSGTVTLPNAPDHQAPLSFILMYAEYLGYPSVPLGVMLIGSVLARLNISELPKGFWKSAVAHTLYRLCILPIFGMAYVAQLKHIGWLKEPMAVLVTAMQFGLPSATVQVYLTAAAMDPDDSDCPALNCLGLYLVCQYAVLVVSLPFVASFCIKQVLHL